MAGARRTADSARAEVNDALAEGKRRAGGDRGGAAAGPRAILALQRRAGNAAVSALMAANLRSPGEQAVSEIDAGLREIRRDEPAIETVEKGLKAAKAAGVAVDLEGPKPPPSALAVTTTVYRARTRYGPVTCGFAGSRTVRQDRRSWSFDCCIWP
jgi:hypothetical protein